MKEKLRRESPPGSNDALIYERVEFQRRPKTIAFVGKGTKTVDVEQIKERFKSLGLSLDEARLDQLRRIRNDIEHHSSKHGHAKVQEAIAQTSQLFNWDYLHLGGGNAKHIKFELAKNVRIVPNEEGLLGGVALWRNE